MNVFAFVVNEIGCLKSFAMYYSIGLKGQALGAVSLCDVCEKHRVAHKKCHIVDI